MGGGNSMGYVKYVVKLYLEGNKTIAGAQITANNRNAWITSTKKYYGTTGPDGVCVWDNLGTGYNNDTYDFKAYYADDEGFEYVAQWSDRLNPTIIFNKEITLRKKYLDELYEIQLGDATKNLLGKTHVGQSTLQAMGEINTCLKQRLPISALTTSTYILEGLIRTMAEQKKVWEDKMEGFTFGQLIKEEALINLFPKGLRDQFEGINKFRIPAAHNKGVKSMIEEAKIGYRLIETTIKVLEESISFMDTVN